MKNFVFISPNFPLTYWKFCAELKNNGMRVLGIGDCPYDDLMQELKDSLHEYYKVSSLENNDEVFRAVAFFTFAFTDLFKGNGYLAVYIAGMIIGNSKIANRKEVATFFDGLTWLFQIVMFILLGLLVNPKEMLGVAPVALLIGAFMILVGRPLSVLISLLPFRWLTGRSRLYISWVGLRGAVPIIFATYPIVAGVEGGTLIFNVVFMGTLISLLVQGTTVSAMANWLGLAYEEKEPLFKVGIPDSIKSNFSELIVTDSMLAKGCTLRDIDIPDNTLVVMISRDNSYFVPRGNTELAVGDRLLVVSDRNEEELQQMYADLGIQEVMNLR